MTDNELLAIGLISNVLGLLMMFLIVNGFPDIAVRLVAILYAFLFMTYIQLCFDRW